MAIITLLTLRVCVCELFLKGEDKHFSQRQKQSRERLVTFCRVMTCLILL